MRLVDIVVEWDLDRERGAVVGIGGNLEEVRLLRTLGYGDEWLYV
tara:strand:+ start:351 stop:485 length:135 start_codon:yes stop_codon:yes gene_type:complete